jgi:hypothetical protein
MSSRSRRLQPTIKITSEKVKANFGVSVRTKHHHFKVRL